jgi:hypothetical protein
MPVCCALRFPHAISSSPIPQPGHSTCTCAATIGTSSKSPYLAIPTSTTLGSLNVLHIPTLTTTLPAVLHPHPFAQSPTARTRLPDGGGGGRRAYTPRASDGHVLLHGTLSAARAASGERGDCAVLTSGPVASGCFAALVVTPAEAAASVAFLASLVLALSLAARAQAGFLARHLAKAVAVAADHVVFR